MVKSLKINPIEKTYPANFRTFESSLAANGLNRWPGTNVPFIPKREADGRYRTGVDKEALYIKKLPMEEQQAEYKVIDELLSELRKVFGNEIDFANPRSPVWNAYGDKEIKASPVKFGIGSVILNPAIDPQDLINYCWLRVHPDIAKSLESSARNECPGCRYYVENSESEARVLYARKKEINKAIAAFESLTPTKQKQVARLLGLPITDESGEEEIYNMIDTLLKKPEFDGGEFKNLNPVKKFTEMVRLSDDRLYVKDLIEQAFRHNIYRKDGNGKVLEGGNIISISKEELADYLVDDTHQKELMALEKSIQYKKIAAL